MTMLHGTCVRISNLGVLLLGAPGSGKSDLALRLIEPVGSAGAMLVADDQVMIEQFDGKLVARPPETIAGRLEVRGVGIVTIPHAAETELRLVVRLDAAGAGERIPDFSTQVTEICGVSIPELRIDPFTASAAAKVRAMVHVLDAGRAALELSRH